jgi:lysophospholipase
LALAVPTKLESGSFPSRDGTRLHGEWHHAPAATSARGVALVVHGYGDHGGRYVEVCRKLADAGLPALAVDYRGHGRAGGRRGHCLSFTEFLDDLDVSLERARAAVDTGPLVLVAHSHGGLIALRALLDGRARQVDALALSSPLLGLPAIPRIKTIAGKAASRLWPTLTMPSGLDPATFTHDQELLRQAMADGLRHDVATARWYTEAVGAIDFVAAHIGKLAVPSFWQLAGDDRVVDGQASRRLYPLAGGDKALKIYETDYHEIFNEVDRGVVFGDLLAWISRVVLKA